MTYSVGSGEEKRYLHRKGNLFWFAKYKNKETLLDDLPEGYEVDKNPKTGRLFVRKS